MINQSGDSVDCEFPKTQLPLLSLEPRRHRNARTAIRLIFDLTTKLYLGEEIKPLLVCLC